MPKKIYTESIGVARSGKQIYPGVGGVARRGKKGYFGVNGVARQFFASGDVKWLKYTVTEETEWVYYEEDRVSGSYEDSYFADTHYFLYSDYAFDSRGGYYGVGSVREYGDSLLGYYDVTPTQVAVLSDVARIQEADGVYIMKTSYVYEQTFVALAHEEKETTYSKKTYIGETYAEAGQLPESGTLLAGQANGDFCVIQIGGTPYYFEKATD